MQHNSGPEGKEDVKKDSDFALEAISSHLLDIKI